MFEEIFLPPQVKRSLIISNKLVHKNGSDKCSNDVRVRTLRDQEISGISQNTACTRGPHGAKSNQPPQLAPQRHRSALIPTLGCQRPKKRANFLSLAAKRRANTAFQKNRKMVHKMMLRPWSAKPCQPKTFDVAFNVAGGINRTIIRLV